MQTWPMLSKFHAAVTGLWKSHITTHGLKDVAAGLLADPTYLLAFESAKRKCWTKGQAVENPANTYTLQEIAHLLQFLNKDYTPKGYMWRYVSQWCAYVACIICVYVASWLYVF